MTKKTHEKWAGRPITFCTALILGLVFWLCGTAWGEVSIVNSSTGHTTTANSTTANDPGTHGFKVFDGTLYKDKPDLSAYGLRNITIIYGENFWKHKSEMNSLPHHIRVERLAREAASKSKVVCIDIENWPVHGDPDVVQDSIRKYAQVMQWFRQAAPDAQYGYYGVLPLGGYWPAIAPRTSPLRQAWEADNAKMLPVAATVNVVFPSLYTYYADPKAWVRFAIEQIHEAKKYGKPVYPFLWPQFHDSNHLLGGRYLPAAYWKLELDTVRAHADGVVIWGGWNLKHDRPAKWNNQAAWWQVTKKFLRQINN